MFEQVDALPGPQHQASTPHRDRQVGLRQRTPEMSGHVVQPLIVMFIGGGFGCQPREIPLQVAPRRGGGILLNQQGSRRVTAEDGQETVGNVLHTHPATNFVRDLVEPGTGCDERQFSESLAEHARALPAKEKARQPLGQRALEFMNPPERGSLQLSGQNPNRSPEASST